MPWCDECDRVVADDEVTEDETCPECGSELAERRRIPWYFKAMLLITVVYLGYRGYQGITWLVHHL